MISTERFLEAYAPLVLGHKASVFCGAGVSVPADIGDWRDLVKPLANDLNLDASRENPLDVIQYYINQSGTHESLVLQRLVEVFSRQADPTEYHLLLAGMPFERYWTTNYDLLLENAIGSPDIVVNDATLISAEPSAKWVIKLNGSIGDRNRELVYSREHFEEFEAKNPTLHRYLLTSLATSSFFFLGFSMTDPTLARALERIREESVGSVTERPHFVVVVRRSDTYERRHQEYWAKELARFRVGTIFVDSYDDVLGVVRKLASRVARRTVCIIGSLASEQRAIRSLCESLGRHLVENGFSVVTGCGHNVGTFCALAALNRIEEAPREVGNASVRTYFTKGGGSSLLRFGETVFVGETYTEMRREMLRSADVGIAIGGRDGAQEEIQLAQDLGVPVVPIASTGGAAEEDWRAGCESLRSVVQSIRDDSQRNELEAFLGGLDAHQKPSRRVPKLIKALQIILEWKAVGGAR